MGAVVASLLVVAAAMFLLRAVAAAVVVIGIVRMAVVLIGVPTVREVAAPTAFLETQLRDVQF